ncbi:hypothetical protein LSM04_009049 [Trypanosoma melophagium]|uniref:uncharacterized protein n=1 Tax=Trypanosoma melophagium TaxID=715481 RepID=UPI003519FA38|nr:hypothetical protein LSM04_009049 [Trypanosoma melophagium]
MDFSGMRLHGTASVSPAPGAYVLDGCVLSGGAAVCVSAADDSLRLFDAATAAPLWALAGHFTAPLRDVTAGGAAAPSLLLAAQADAGVLVADTRERRPVVFLDEFTTSGAPGGSVAIAPSGRSVAIAVGGDVHFVDTRTWCSTHCIPRMHMDEITRVRFLSDEVYCSAGEDQMINFIHADPRVPDADILIHAVACGEVVTKMNTHTPLGLLSIVGSCENAYIAPLDLENGDVVRHARPDPAAYLVDTCILGGELYHVWGSRDEEGNPGPISIVNAYNPTRVVPLPQLHTEICRVALSIDDCFITGGEDNIVAFWRASTADNDPNAAAAIHDASQRKGMIPRPTAKRPLRSVPYAK